MIKLGEKTRFLLVNMLKGFAWLAVLVFLFIYVKNNFNIDFEDWLGPVFDNTLLVLSIYALSELILGIFPPELFMMWALRFGSLEEYVFWVFVFSAISYLAGWVGYLFGNYLNSTILFRYIRKRFLGKYHSLLQKFGVFLILVAALTPVPFSAISMLVGSLHYPMKKYMLWALSRFIRFAVYAFIIWEAGLI